MLLTDPDHYKGQKSIGAFPPATIPPDRPASSALFSVIETVRRVARIRLLLAGFR